MSIGHESGIDPFPYFFTCLLKRFLSEFQADEEKEKPRKENANPDLDVLRFYGEPAADRKASGPRGRLLFSRDSCKPARQIYKFGLFCPGRMMYNHAEKNSDGKKEKTDTLPALVEAGKVYAERLENGFDVYY